MSNIGKSSLDDSKMLVGRRLWTKNIPDQLIAENFINTYLLQGANINQNVNGSITPVSYIYTVPADKVAYIVRSFLAIEDGAVAFSPGNFGAIAALINGWQILLNGTEIANFKTNRDIRTSMFDFDEEFAQAGSYVGRWSFYKDLNFAVFVLNAGETFESKVRDDLTDLDYLTFRIRGILKDIPANTR